VGAVTRDELEAEVWRELTAMACGKSVQGAFVDAVLNAADRYALAKYATPADRRAELAEATARLVHWQHPGTKRPSVAACHGKQTNAPVRSDRAKVTCEACKRSHAWQVAS
jgi:hypothetical protein